MPEPFKPRWVHPALRDCQLKEQELQSDKGKHRDIIRSRVRISNPIGQRVPDKSKSGLKF